MRILAIGLGNNLRTDDGIGLHVIKKLHEVKPEIDTIEVGLGSIEILEYMKGYNTVFIIDAIKTGEEPGTIYKVNLSDNQEVPQINYSHGVDIASTIKFGKIFYQNVLPEKIFLLAVEAEDIISLGEEPTKKVKQAIDEVINEIINLI